MKKLRILICILVIGCIFSSINILKAVDADLLISVGTGAYAIQVKKTTTINQIIAVLGQPKLKTESAFGGFAYTFYTDSNYSNYLFVETTSDEKIVSYGSVDKTFQTNTYSYGDSYPYTDLSSLVGCLDSNGGTVGAAIFYNKSAVSPATSNTIINLFKTTYVKNETKYLKGIAEHGVLMFNAYSKNLNKSVTLTFNEDMFYVNEQLKEFNSSIREYLIEMNKTSAYAVGLGVSTSIELSNGSYYLLNPLLFGCMARSTLSGTDFSSKNIAIFDYNSSKKILSGTAISNNLFDIADSVSLTTEEQSKLSAGRYEYASAMENLNKDNNLFDINPVYSSASSLVAGKLKQSKMQGITDYVNAIRVAGGIPKLTADNDLFDVGQHIATLLSYRYISLGLPIAHQPAKPDGVSDTYYNQAIGYGKGYAENLGFSSNAQPSVEKMLTFMNLFLDDSFETPQIFSHRVRVLNSRLAKFGFGISYMTASNEFTGVQNNSSVVVEAWPSNGITFLETLSSRKFAWTAKFLDKYTVQDTTTARIKCLNTGATWMFDGYEKTSSRWFECSTTQVSSINNKVIMYDSTINPEPGQVYEITIYGLINTTNSMVESYTYRAAFEYADLNNYPTQITDISIQAPADVVKVDDTNIYYVPVDEEAKFSAIIDTSATDKKVTWISSDPSAVTVTQNGTVIAHKITENPITITVCYDGTSITSEIQVLPYNKLNQVKLSSNEITLEAETIDGANNGSSIAIDVESFPEDATIKDITWVVVSSANPTVEYAINDSYITKYLKVTVNPTDVRKITAKAVTAEKGNNEYTIIAKVKGINGTYTGSCKILIHVPITSIKFSPVSPTHEIINNERLDIIYNPSTDSEYFNLNAICKPDNTSESTVVTWSTSNASVISVYDNGASQFKIVKAGTAVLTAKAGSLTAGQSITINIRVPLTKLVLADSLGEIFKLSDTESQNYRTLALTKTPAISNDEVEWSSSNINVATVSSTGSVHFLDEGSVTITVKSKIDNSIKATYNYTIIKPVKSISITPSKIELTKGEGKSITITPSPLIDNIYGKVTYTYSNPGVAIVLPTGLVVGQKTGTTVVTATVASTYAISSTIKASFTVDVVAPLTGISMDNTRMIIVNNSSSMTVTLNPTDTTDELEYTWSTENPSIVSINSKTGIFKGVSAGTAKITVQVYNKTRETTFEASTLVTVKNYQKGDMNKDGIVDSTDASIVMTLFKRNSATTEDLEIGDMNLDGVLDTTDAAMILTIYKRN